VAVLSNERGKVSGTLPSEAPEEELPGYSEEVSECEACGGDASVAPAISWLQGIPNRQVKAWTFSLSAAAGT